MRFAVGDPVRVSDPESPYFQMSGRVTYLDGGDVFVTLRSTDTEKAFSPRQLAARDETPLSAAQMRERMAS
jgi:hypothetical protein